MAVGVRVPSLAPYKRNPERVMKFTWEDSGVTKKKLNVEVPAEKVTELLDAKIKQAGKTAKLKGFRPGKAPLGMIKKLYGPQLEQEVTQELINSSMDDALKEKEYNLAVSPSLDDSSYEDGKPFTFSLSMEIKPSFEVENYEDIELKKEEVNVTPEMMEDRIEQLRKSQGTINPVEDPGPIKDGDMAVISYKAFVGEEPVEGGDNPSYQLEVGKGNFSKGFEDNLIGMTVDEDKEFTVKFAEDHYSSAFANKEVRFEVVLTGVKEMVLPELNDDFAKGLGADIETMEALEERLKQDMIAMEERRIEEDLRKALNEKLLELVDFELPEGMVQGELESMVEKTKFNLERSGLSLEAAGMSIEKLKEDYQSMAEKQVKTSLILEKIATEKSLTVSEEELKMRIFQMAAQSGQDPEKMMELYSQNYMLGQLSRSILEEKTLNFVMENANIDNTSESAEADSEIDAG